MRNQPASFDAVIFTVEGDGLAGMQAPPDGEELVRLRVAFVMGHEHAVAGQFTGLPPTTTFSSSRPLLRRSSAAVWRAAKAGVMTPGRSATRNFSRSVTVASPVAVIQLSAGLARGQQHA